MNNEHIIDVNCCENANIPTKGSIGAAGSDLYACFENVKDIVEIQPGDRKLIDTGIQISIPSYCYGRIASRSGLALKGIDVAAGVVDSDYRGPLRVLLVNNGKEVFEIKHADRIAQLILERIINPVFRQTSTLDSTKRGDNGFGSTGI